MSAGAANTTATSVSTDLLSQTANLTTSLTTTVETLEGTGFTSPLPTPPTQTPAAGGVANPPYIVLTATPTTETAAPTPTITPYPTTGAPQAAVNLLGMRVPDTQNLMIMLLCGVFSGASGLGILGLISTLLYMRSRAGSRQNHAVQRRF